VKIRKFALLVSVVGVCLLLLTLQARGYGASARDLLALVTTPVQAGVARAHRAAFGIWGTYQDWKNVRTENRRLRDDNQRLRVEALRVTGVPIGVAPHSVRAVPQEWFRAIANYSHRHQLPLHIHADEQIAEIEAKEEAEYYARFMRH